MVPTLTIWMHTFEIITNSFVIGYLLAELDVLMPIYLFRYFNAMEKCPFSWEVNVVIFYLFLSISFPYHISSLITVSLNQPQKVLFRASRTWKYKNSAVYHTDTITSYCWLGFET